MVRTRSCKEDTQMQVRTKSTKEAVQKKKAIAKAQPISQDQLRSSVIQKLKNKTNSIKVSAQHQVQKIEQSKVSQMVTADKFQCPICLQTLLEPTLTPCGHAFCLHCVQESIKHKDTCSICRHKVSFDTLQPSFLLDKLIKKVLLASLSQEERAGYSDRQQKFKETQELRRISQEIAVGDLVDYFIEGHWHQGKILEINQVQGKETQLVIQSTSDSSKHITMEKNSRLLAKHRYFSTEINSIISPIRIQIMDLHQLFELGHFLRNPSWMNMRISRGTPSSRYRGQVRLTFHYFNNLQ